MNKTQLGKMRMRFLQISTLITVGALTFAPGNLWGKSMSFGPANPFYAPSTLPFQAPPFDKIKDADYQPAIEAGIAQKIDEIRAIADNPAEPTFENTMVAMEKSGRLIDRVMNVFNGVSGANMNPVLAKGSGDGSAEAGCHAGCDLPECQAVPARRPRSTNSASLCISMRNPCVWSNINTSSFCSQARGFPTATR